MMKVLYFSGEDWEEKYVEGKLDGVDVEIISGPIQGHPDLRDEEAEVLSVFVKSHVGAQEMDRFPNIKLIATRSTGFDHIDTEEAKKRGIVVANVPTYGENTVAEYAFALLLALSRKIPESYEQVRETGSFSQKNLRGFDLIGKTLGVVGCGHIGVHAIKMAKGFGMNVIVSDVHQNDSLCAELDFKYVSFDELLSSSDIISLHVPYNEHTHHLINSENINKIKKGAYLINTARGAIVDTKALIEGLKSGIFAGAGLDVLEEEGIMMGDETELLFDKHPNEEGLKTVLANHYLIDHPRVLVMPHNAYNTDEALHRIVDTTIENIKNFQAGNPTNII